MNKTRLLVLADPSAPYLRPLEAISDLAEIEMGAGTDFIRAAAPTAEVILCAGFTADTFRLAWPLAKKARWVHTISAGVEHLITPEFAASPVPFTNARGVYKRSLAEFALTGILYFAKNIPRMLRQQRLGKWEQFEVTEAHGHTVGVVGFGEIGRASAQLARALGMKVLALRRRPELSSSDDADAVFPPDKLREMLSLCDYVVAAAPLTPETRGLIGEPELRSLKPSAVVINVGRGPVIHEASLILALKEGWIQGAALDVFEQEPLPPNHPFWGMENVLISPHCADRTPGWLEQSIDLFLANFHRYRDGEPLLNLVDKKASY
jgi:phosphoglycerate dehydrogenase-like enzyme